MLAIHCCCAPGALHCRICSLSSSSVSHLRHLAMAHCPHHCIFFPWANRLVICLVTHLHLCVGSSRMAHSMALLSTLLSVGDRCGIFNCQYFFAGGPFKALRSATFGFLTFLLPVISMYHDSFGIWYSTLPSYNTSMQAFTARSASIFSHACQDSTMGCPLSWCPFMCEYITLHGRSCSVFLCMCCKWVNHLLRL